MNFYFLTSKNYIFVFNKIRVRLRLILPYFIFLTLGCVEEVTIATCQQQDRNSMEFKFQNYETAHAAREALNKILPHGSSKESVIQQMKNIGATLYEIQDNVLPARFVESSLTMVHVVWSLAFYFNEDMKLDKIEVRRGLTGP